MIAKPHLDLPQGDDPPKNRKELDSTQGDEVEAILLEREARGLGLAGMRERVSLLGGNFVVESTPGRGTTIQVRIPTGEEQSCPSAS